MSKTVCIAMSSDIVFDRPLNAARRRCRYGHQAMMARHLKWVCGLDQCMRDSSLYA